MKNEKVKKKKKKHQNKIGSHRQRKRLRGFNKQGTKVNTKNFILVKQVEETYFQNDY